MRFIKFFKEFSLLESFELIRSGGLGSNPGGMYKDSQTGEQYYIKFPQIDSEQAIIETLSSKILTSMGIRNLEPEVVDIEGRIGVATKWVSSLKPITNRDLSGLIEPQANDIGKIFSHAVLVKNWDVVGNGIDYGSGNIFIVGDKIYAGDTGGSFCFRAQGRRKDYTPDVSELESLLSMDRNVESSRFLRTVFTKFPNALTEGKKMVQNMDMGEIKKLFDETKLSESDQLFNTFKIRRSLFLENIDEVANKFQ